MMHGCNECYWGSCRVLASWFGSPAAIAWEGGTSRQDVAICDTSQHRRHSRMCPCTLQAFMSPARKILGKKDCRMLVSIATSSQDPDIFLTHSLQHLLQAPGSSVLVDHRQNRKNVTHNLDPAARLQDCGSNR